MRWFLQWRNALMLPTLLGTMLSLAGCLSISTTQTVETDLVTGVCKAWQPTTYSSRDTPETQTGNRANNAARKAWGCP